MTLDTLNSDVLLSISDHLAFSDVLQFSKTCKSIRSALGPILWDTIIFGQGKRSPKHTAAARALSSMSHVLNHTRYVMLGSIFPEAIPAIVDCLKKMPKLTHFINHGASPVPTLIARALCEVPTLASLSLRSFGGESLSSVASVKSLKEIDICCTRNILSAKDLLPHAPLTVARDRRMSQLSLNGDPGPTIDENVDAIVKALAQLLIASSDTLDTLALRQWESGDWLEKLHRELARLGGRDVQFPCLRSAHLGSPDKQHQGDGAIGRPEFPRFLQSVPALERLVVSHASATAPLGPTVPLLNLKTLIFVILPESDVTKACRGFWEGSVLDYLALDGIHANYLSGIFAAPPNAPALRKLFLRVLSTTGISSLSDVFKACPNLEDFKVHTSFWHCEMKPRSMPFPWPDGRTIRSERHGDFRVIAVAGPGQTIASVATSRIREDIEAVKPVYVKRFTKLARRLPSLQTVVWHATDEVVWTWTFTRGSEGNINFKQKADIELSSSMAQYA
ncbi:hypothetical protein RQP46_001790 [Phenoliferia psychrophenolica]